MKLKKETTIKISKEMMNELKSLGKMGDTYDDVIQRLILSYKNIKNEHKEEKKNID